MRRQSTAEQWTAAPVNRGNHHSRLGPVGDYQPTPDASSPKRKELPPGYIQGTRIFGFVIDVILPVLNEAQALPWVMKRMPNTFTPIVVDNGSTDGSGDVATDLGARVIREPQPGFGAACDAGLRASTSDVVCFMDCDGSLDPGELPDVAAPVLRGASELVLGARQAAKGSWPTHARVANAVVTWHLYREYGVELSDLGPMRAMLRTKLVRLNVLDRRFGWPLEMVTRAAKAGWRISETPVTYLPRVGRSKVTGTLTGTVRTVHDMAKVLLC